jgi:hypothetical protein
MYTKWKLKERLLCLIKPTFLPLVENRRTGVVLALLFRVRKLFSATLMDTLLSHFVRYMGFILHRLRLTVWRLYGRDRRKKNIWVSQALVGWELLEFKLLTTVEAMTMLETKLFMGSPLSYFDAGLQLTSCN